MSEATPIEEAKEILRHYDSLSPANKLFDRQEPKWERALRAVVEEHRLHVIVEKSAEKGGE